MKQKNAHELACLDACDYADFAASRDGEDKSVYYSSDNGGTFRVLNSNIESDWLLIYKTAIIR